MDHLLQLHPNRPYYFYYYFKVDDINRHYYIVDAGLEVVTEMPVTNPAVLQFIDDKLYELNTRKSGLYLAQDTTNWRNVGGERLFSDSRRNIFYVLTEDSADFTRLRIAIMKDTARQQARVVQDLPDPKIYSSSEVDQPAVPVRGKEYFRRAIEEEVRHAEALILYDTGTVEVIFRVRGQRVHSPNLVRGLSAYYDTHEAYQADGEFIKAINRARVWWHDAQKNGHPVESTVTMTFDINQLKN